MDAGSKHSLDGIVGLIDALNCGAFVTDVGGRIVHANPRLCEMLRLGEADVIGQDPIALYPDEDTRTRAREHLSQFETTHEGEFFLPQPDGGELPVVISGRRLDGDSPLSGHRLITVVDIAKQKLAEENMRERYAGVAKLSDTVLEQALELKHYSENLEERVQERTAEIHEANMDAIYMLAVASEAKDQDTGAHVRRIETYTRAVAAELGMEEATAQQWGYASILHDVGKMSVPDRILKKPGPLTTEERRQMECHAVTGEQILSKKSFFDIARQIARSHHENWDGSGYPDRLKAEAIPLPARIVHVVDVFDALVSKRVYKPAWPVAKVMQAIEEGSGGQFDPQAVEVLKALVEAGRLDKLAEKSE